MKAQKKWIALFLANTVLLSTFPTSILGQVGSNPSSVLEDLAQEEEETDTILPEASLDQTVTPSALEAAPATVNPSLKSAFEKLIVDATGLNNRTSVGTKAGNATEAQKYDFTKSIADAKTLLQRSDLTDADLVRETERLQQHMDLLRNQKTTWQPYASYVSGNAMEEKRHFRATWIATVINMDWPSKETLSIANDAQRIEAQKKELLAKLDEAQALKLNAVIFQVRPTSDTFYRSNIEPWSYFLTGTLGKDPGYDPLEFAITEAHKRNLELHAWFNPYRISMPASFYSDNGKTLTTLDELRGFLSKDPNNIYSKHPEWSDVAQNRLVLDPGIPEAREYIEKVIMEVVHNYDMDAIHFDDYFYTGVAGGADGIQDEDTFAQYGDGFSDIKDWRRHNTQTLIENLSQQIKAAKPWVKFGISPAGVWRNMKDDPQGSDTGAGAPNYDHAYADTRKWVMDNTIDYIVPQVYWSAGREVASYTVISDWWSDVIAQSKTDTQLYIGQALYKMTLADQDKNDDYFIPGTHWANTEMSNQIKYNMANPSITGSVLFRHNNLDDPMVSSFLPILKEELWDHYVFVPTMKNLGGMPPAAPTITSLTKVPNGLQLTWADNERNLSEMQATKYFAIYKTSSSDTIRQEDPTQIIGVVSRLSEQTFVDVNGKKGDVYRISAFNRLHDESPLSEAKVFEDASNNSNKSSGGGSGSGTVYTQPSTKTDDDDIIDQLKTETKTEITVPLGKETLNLSGKTMILIAEKNKNLVLEKNNAKLTFSSSLLKTLNLNDGDQIQIQWRSAEIKTGLWNGLDPIQQKPLTNGNQLSFIVNNKAIEVFTQPILFQKTFNNTTLAPHQRNLFTGVYFDSTAASQLGGRWNNDTFVFYGYHTGVYGVGIAKQLTKVTLTIASPVVMIDGQEKTFDVAPFLMGDRTYVPIRFIAEALGCSVEWKGESSTVVLQKGTEKIILPIDGAANSPQALLKNDRVFVPLRYISETLGANVVWHKDTQQIDIYQ